VVNRKKRMWKLRDTFLEAPHIVRCVDAFRDSPSRDSSLNMCIFEVEVAAVASITSSKEIAQVRNIYFSILAFSCT
jgi:hypothetical protein